MRIPENWILIPLTEIVDINPPKPSKDAFFEGTLVSFIPMAAVDAINGEITKHENRPFEKVSKGYTAFKENDVIFAKITPCMENGKAAIAKNLENGIGFGSTEFHVFRSFNAIIPSFLYYFIRQARFRRIAQANMTGSAGQKRVPTNFLKNYSVPLPPHSEQHRIVAKIEELFSDLDKGIESLKKAQVQLKIYRQTVLKYAFEGKLTAEWRKSRAETQRRKEEKETEENLGVLASWRDETKSLLEQIKQEREKHYNQQFETWKQAIKAWEAKGKHSKKPAKPKKPKELPPLTDEELAELPELPEGWCWVRFGYHITEIDAGKSFKCEERPPNPSEIGVAKVSAVSWGEYNEYESKTCIDQDKVNTRYLIQEGDFLFSRANTIELVGACVIAKNPTLKVMLSDKTLRLNFLTDSKWYSLYFLRSRLGRREIERLATGNQESMRNIGQDRIRKIITPLCPLSEQHQIVAEIESRLSVCDKLEQTIEESLQKAESLRQSILKKAFEGKLVPQDPNDEPAEKLLERIKKTR